MKIEKFAYQKGYRIDKEGVLFNPKGKTINGCLDKNGYRITSMLKDGKTCLLVFHRFQAFSLYGIKLYEKGILTRHLNNNKLDNSSKNIALGNYVQNALDIPLSKRMRMGRHATLCRKHITET